MANGQHSEGIFLSPFCLSWRCDFIHQLQLLGCSVGSQPADWWEPKVSSGRHLLIVRDNDLTDHRRIYSAGSNPSKVLMSGGQTRLSGKQRCLKGVYDIPIPNVDYPYSGVARGEVAVGTTSGGYRNQAGVGWYCWYYSGSVSDMPLLFNWSACGRQIRKRVSFQRWGISTPLVVIRLYYHYFI